MRKSLLIVFLLAWAGIVQAQEVRDSMRVYYRTGYRTVDTTFRDNRHELSHFIQSIKDAMGRGELERVIIRSCASPDGTNAANERLAARRADSLQEVMLVSPKTPVDGKMALMRQVVADNEKNGADSTLVIDLFKKILKEPQETSDMAQLYAAYLTLKKMPQDSISKVLETVLAISPDNVAARLQLIQAEWNKQDFDRVIELSNQALDYSPDELAFYYFLGFAYIQKDDDDSALEVLRRGVSQINDQSNPSLVSDFYAIMGDILHDKGDDKGAYAAYDSCLQWKDDNYGCLNNYAYYLSVENKDLDKAAQMSYRTVQAEPDNSTFLDTYAWILFMQKKYAEALQYIDMAVKNDTTKSAVIIEHAGDIHAVNGDIDGAVKYWNEALKAGAENETVLRRKIKLRKYVEK